MSGESRYDVRTTVDKEKVKLEWRPPETWKDFRKQAPGDHPDAGVVCWFAVMRELKKVDYPDMLHSGDEDTFLEHGKICTWNRLMNRFHECGAGPEHLDDVRYWTELPAWPEKRGTG